MLKIQFTNNSIECGCDEAGRGCLAGPVVAAAVVLDPTKPIPELNDSKKLSEKVRLQLSEEIKKTAIAWSIGMAKVDEIDQINILNASILAMQRAVLQLKIKPDLLLIDGNRFKPMENYTHHCIVKGDSLYQSIAAASILAKTTRDSWMKELAENYPVYYWQKNKGYPTLAHYQALNNAGPCEHHRRTFKLNKPIDLL